jgi:hypothetical protein
VLLLGYQVIKNYACLNISPNSFVCDHVPTFFNVVINIFFIVFFIGLVFISGADYLLLQIFGIDNLIQGSIFFIPLAWALFPLLFVGLIYLIKFIYRRVVG